MSGCKPLSHTRTELFNDLPIIFREDGYINMTKTAAHFGKKLPNFWRMPETTEYMAELSRCLTLSGLEIGTRYTGNSVGMSPFRYRTSFLATTVPGNRYVADRGTWCHPKLAIFFARWLDVRFAVWCDLMIDNILKGNIQTTVVVPTVEAV